MINYTKSYTGGIMVQETNTNKAQTPPDSESKKKFILITQCLQNNFFLSRENQIRLEETQALQMMLKGSTPELVASLNEDDKKAANQRVIKNQTKQIKEGPLYQFFEHTIGSSLRKNHLHVIHIKDWHVPSEAYNYERRRYGSHCEANTWEADSISGYDNFLKPWDNENNNSQLNKDGFKLDPKTTFYEIRSNSLHDFTHKIAKNDHLDHLSAILDDIILEEGVNPQHVYIVVIGVLTDIKIKLLLTNLRSRYNLPNLATSDVLTASNTLERHLSGLDFADKVLGVEIVHSLNALVSILNPMHDDSISADIIKARPNFNDYRTYYLDKQNILSFQDRQLIRYLDLAGNRGNQAYQTIFQINRGLAIAGFAFLALTLFSAVYALFHPTTELITLTGLLGTISIAEFIAVFFTGPSTRLQDNLTNLIRMRNYMESYSSMSALLRHHLTAPEMLQIDETETQDNPGIRKIRINALREQMKIIEEASNQLATNLGDITGINDDKATYSSANNTASDESPDI